jgi:carboxylesterase
MLPLGEALAARGFYVKGIRLPGHGTTPEAMTHVTHRDWEQAVEDALRGLSNFRQVFVAGLSMGALLSVLLAARSPARVHGVALIAPAMKFLDRQMAALRFLRAASIAEVLHPWVEKDSTDIGDPIVRAQAPVLPRFPVARLRDVWTLQDHAREALSRVRCPALIAIARDDHVVSAEGARELAQRLTQAPTVRFIELTQGFHIIPRDRDGPVLAREVGDFFARLRS